MKNIKKIRKVNRDKNILLHLKSEINLGTRVKKDISKYSRKIKHKKSF